MKSCQSIEISLRENLRTTYFHSPLFGTSQVWNIWNNEFSILSLLWINNNRSIEIDCKNTILCFNEFKPFIISGSAASFEVLYVGLIDFGCGACAACIFFFIYSMRNVLAGLFIHLKFNNIDNLFLFGVLHLIFVLYLLFFFQVIQDMQNQLKRLEDMAQQPTTQHIS